MRFESLTVHQCATFNACSPGSGWGYGVGGGSDGGGDDNGVNPLCSDPDYRASHLTECTDDPQCSGPSFAAANPTLCLNSPRLIIKPSYATCEVLGEVQYKAYLWINGEETLLDDGDVIFSVFDTSIALIGVFSGNATGVAAGITTVLATYGTLTAAAQLEVVAEGACAERENYFAMLFDTSKSSGGVFAPFGTRLDAAEDFANDFVGRTDFTKDRAAVLSFNETASTEQDFTQTLGDLTAAINALTTTTKHTNLSVGLAAAKQLFDDSAVPDANRVIVLFTDGENNQGDDPVTLADELRGEGIILIVVGLRSKLTPFRLLESMASGGFFLNALASNASSIPDYLSGMKSYLCSGNCTPEGDVTLGVGSLNYTGLTYWDTTAGYVDLIGKNDGGTPLFDFLPGNGLYLDGAGSGGGSPSNLATIRTKDLIPVTNAHVVGFTVAVAGNQREDRTPDITTLHLYDQTDTLVASKTITVADYAQDFTDYTLTFPVGGGVTDLRLVIEQTSVGSGGTEVFGNLWDNVRLVDLTSSVTLFEDNFDAENPTYIPPACGYGGGHYGYDCDDLGCLDAPIPAQSPDPAPLGNLENEKSAHLYTATRSAKACCPDDGSNCATRVATADSDVSQADANQKAYAAALALAQAALSC